MKFRYLLSGEGEDLPLDPSLRTRPFRLRPGTDHPFLTLGDFFEALRRFLRADGRIDRLAQLAMEGQGPGMHAVDCATIRLEKHGRFYHVASLRVDACLRSVRFALSAAVSPEARSLLAREATVLRELEEHYHPPHLPKVFLFGDTEAETGARTLPLSILVTEWFEGYHEWHAAAADGPVATQVLVWDETGGRRPLRPAQVGRIIREAARILTLCYEPSSFRQVLLWHHAAGDFVADVSGEDIRVRLTTARDYGAHPLLRERNDALPLTALVYFFLDMTFRIRLDRLDGVGEPVFLEEYTVEEAVRGFFEALAEIRERKDCPDPSSFLAAMKSLGPGDLRAVMAPLENLWQQTNPEAFFMMEYLGDSHLNLLHRLLRRF